MVTAGAVAATGPTIETNSKDTLVLKATKPKKSSSPAKAMNKKMRRVGRESFVLVIFVQETNGNCRDS